MPEGPVCLRARCKRKLDLTEHQLCPVHCCPTPGCAESKSNVASVCETHATQASEALPKGWASGVCDDGVTVCGATSPSPTPALWAHPHPHQYCSCTPTLTLTNTALVGPLSSSASPSHATAILRFVLLKSHAQSHWTRLNRSTLRNITQLVQPLCRYTSTRSGRRRSTITPDRSRATHYPAQARCQ